MSVEPRFSLRSTGTPAASSATAYNSPRITSSGKSLELTTTALPLLVLPPDCAAVVGVASPPVVPDVPGVGVAPLSQAANIRIKSRNAAAITLDLIYFSPLVNCALFPCMPMANLRNVPLLIEWNRMTACGGLDVEAGKSIGLAPERGPRATSGNTVGANGAAQMRGRQPHRDYIHTLFYSQE